MGFSKPKEIKPPPPPPPPVTTTGADAAYAAEAERQKQKRRRGYASTLLTGPEPVGAQSGQKTLLGGN